MVEAEVEIVGGKYGRLETSLVSSYALITRSPQQFDRFDAL